MTRLLPGTRRFAATGAGSRSGTRLAGLGARRSHGAFRPAPSAKPPGPPPLSRIALRAFLLERSSALKDTLTIRGTLERTLAFAHAALDEDIPRHVAAARQKAL